MSDDAAAALARTVQLIAVDVFEAELGADPALEAAIVRGLQNTTIRMVANADNLASPTGRTAFVTLFALVAMMGVAIELDIPDVRLRSAPPPLRSASLRTALVDYGHDLIPNARICAGPSDASPDLTFVFGDSPAPAGVSPILRVTGTAWRCVIARKAAPRRWRGSWPIGALAAAGAAAVEGFRVALRRTAETAGRCLPPERWWHFDPNVHVGLDLSAPGVKARPIALGRVDFISGGAVTTAALYCLLQFAAVSGKVRIIEPDEVNLDNLNRYILARRSDCKKLKVDLLAGFQTNALAVSGIAAHFDRTTRGDLEPLAARVIVGVDDIPSRWAAQSASDGFLCVGATSHFFGMVTTHRPGQPCAGCAHPRDDDGTSPIPTISFVSFWAGFMQAHALLVDAAGSLPKSACVNISPLGLYGPHGLHPVGVAAHRDCPVRCIASRAA